MEHLGRRNRVVRGVIPWRVSMSRKSQIVSGMGLATQAIQSMVEALHNEGLTEAEIHHALVNAFSPFTAFARSVRRFERPIYEIVVNYDAVYAAMQLEKEGNFAEVSVGIDSEKRLTQYHGLCLRTIELIPVHTELQISEAFRLFDEIAIQSKTAHLLECVELLQLGIAKPAVGNKYHVIAIGQGANELGYYPHLRNSQHARCPGRRFGFDEFRTLPATYHVGISWDSDEYRDKFPPIS
jgi:hypothetical protein